MRRVIRYVPAVVLILAFVGVVLQGSLPVAPINAWVAGGNPLAQRTGACAVTLADGNVLIAGGLDAGNPLASAEIVSKSDGSFSAAASMLTARSRHACAALPDGRVLVMGGVVSGGGITNDTEIYDPSSGTWSPGPPMSGSGRAGHTASVLSDGKVVIAGGENGSAVLASVEIYDPEANTFAPAGSLNGPRKDHGAAVTLDGWVWIGGGQNATQELATVEIYDPVTHSSTPGPPLAAPRSSFVAMTLPNNGHVLIAGGASAEMYRPWTSSFVEAGAPVAARTGAAGAPLGVDGYAVVAGGSDPASSELFGFATVKTDKADYSPGETVTITGRGWQPGETVTLSLREIPLIDSHPLLSVVADANGSIISTQFSPDEHDLGITFILTASGVSSGRQAQNKFTDARQFTAVISPTTASQGVATVYTLTVTNTSTGTPTGPIGSVCVTTPSGMTVSGTPTVSAIDGDGTNRTAGWTATTVGAFRSISGSGSGDFDIDPTTGTIVITFTATATTTGTKTWTTVAFSGNSSTCNGTAFGISGSQPTVNVTAANTAPTVNAGPDATINEGGTFAQSGSFTDPDADTWTATVDYGDGGGPQALALSGKNFTLSHTYADNGSYTVTVTVTDDDTGVGSDTVTVTVNNVAPVVNAGANATIDEGGTFSQSGSFTDPGADTWTATVDYGDGGGPQALALSGKNFTLNHVYADNGVYTVTVAVTDDDGGSGTDTVQVTVNNVAPVVNAGADATIDEGGTFSQSGSFTDPGADTWTATVDYGDGSGVQALALSGKNFTLSHVYADNGVYTVTVAVTDDDTGSGSDTVQVTVNNVAPAVNAGADATINEGATFSQGGSFTDPGTDTWTATVDYGDGGGTQALALSGKNFTLSHVYADNGVYTVTVAVTDDDGGSGTDTVQVTVNNVAPSNVSVTPSAASINENDSVTLNGSFSDPGTLDTHTVVIDWGDGSSTTTLDLAAGVLTFSVSHQYLDDNPTATTSDVNSISVTVTDKDGDSDSGSTSVTVNNVAPSSLSLSVTPAAVNEGDTVTLNGSFTDQGTLDTHTVTINWNDGSPNTTLNLAAGVLSFSATHSYADDNPSGTPSDSVTIGVTVADDDTGTTSGNTNVTVNNVAPTVNAGADATIDEGGTFSQSGSFTDPGADTWTATVDYGDGSGVQALALSGKNFTLSHTYADNGTYTVIVTVTDDDTGSGSDTLQVTVNNVAPVVSAGADATIDEGGTFSQSGSFTDPGADTWTATVNYGDGSGVQALALSGKNFTLSHTYADNGPYTVIVTVTDDDTGSGSDAVQVTVNNVAPVVTSLSLNSATINENDSVALSGTFTDPGTLDTHTVVINWGDGSGNTVIPLAAGILTFPAVNHQYLDDSPTGTSSDLYTITVTVTDKDSGSGSAPAGVTVNNLAPAISSVTGPSGPIQLGSSASITANFTDVGSLDTHTCEFSWDDSTSNTSILASGTGNGSCTATHTYTTAGVYAVGVTVTDDDTGNATFVYEYVVVYDPSAGFVTGGGWINSPAGAYIADPTLTGKANFGFVSKYQKGATVPTGETEFQFKTGDLNFHSTLYQWLVVSGAKAQYKGSGTVNGAGDYGFLLTATDGQATNGGGVDKFRIKIWEKASSTLVYDNVVGASEDIDAATPQAIAGGSIVVHTAKK